MCRYLGLDSHLILRTSRELADADPGLTGNLLLARMVCRTLTQPPLPLSPPPFPPPSLSCFLHPARSTLIELMHPWPVSALSICKQPCILPGHLSKSQLQNFQGSMSAKDLCSLQEEQGGRHCTAYAHVQHVSFI